METTPPFPIVSGQRQLSVIMFTDAVGYSARMHAQEVATLNRVERDAEIMRRIIESQSGTVLKSTGDGLLIQFTSAVQAVACAQEIQRLFSTPTDPGDSRLVLRYRIGIHLGDVFVGNGDAMGDGVNIAARLVGLAPPGGILISQTVYDVVKNKLPLQVLRVGPQQLKNIKEPVTLYRVLLEEKRRPTGPTPTVPNTPAPAQAPAAPAAARHYRRWLLVAVAVAVLAFTAQLLLREYRSHQEELRRSQSAQAAFGDQLKQAGAATPGSTGDAVTPAPAHDFAALVTRKPAANDISAETAGLRLAAEQGVERLFQWLAEDLPHYTRERPLPVAGLGDPGFAGARIFLDQDGKLTFAEGNAYRRREWDDLRPSVQGAIIVSALRESARSVPSDVRNGAAAFAYLRGLPEMAAALQHRN